MKEAEEYPYSKIVRVTLEASEKTFELGCGHSMKGGRYLSFAAGEKIVCRECHPELYDDEGDH